MTITEAVIALFLIAYCALTVFQLLNLGVNIDGRAERAECAVAVASRHMQRLRQWAETPANFESDWSTQVGTSVDAEFPEYQVTVEATSETLYSPCSQLESNWAPPSNPVDDRRKMPNTFKKVLITASWKPGSASSQVTIVSLVGAPSQRLATLNIQTTSPYNVPMNHDEAVNATVVAQDAGGNNLKDVFFRWWHRPTSVSGSVGSFPPTGQTRDGRTTQFKHFYCIQTVSGISQPVYGPAGNLTVSVAGRCCADVGGDLTLQMGP